MRSANEQKESWVETYLLAECTKLGALCVKIQHLTGWPDRMIIWYGGVIDFIELKRPKGGRYEPLQLRTHAKLRQRGHNVFVINSREQIDEYIRSRRESSRRSALPLR